MKAILVRSRLFGPVAVLWSVCDGEPKVSRVLLSSPERSALERLGIEFPGCEVSSCVEIARVAAGIDAFLRGRDIRFSLDCLQWSACPPFQRAVLRAEHGIPRGSVSTYKLLAARVGNPRGARAVGNALANNPFPIIVPCHRAIRSDRSLGGFQGGLAMKRALLEREGISFDRKGRVVGGRFHYEERGVRIKRRPRGMQ